MNNRRNEDEEYLATKKELVTGMILAVFVIVIAVIAGAALILFTYA